MSIAPTPITEELAAYVVAHAGGRDDALTGVESETAALGGLAVMQTSPEQAALRALPHEPTLDLAYLDADKASYPDYYAELVPRLRPGGVLAIDNVLMGGRILDPPEDDAGARAVAALNDRILADDRVDSVLLGMADGLTLVRRRDAS